MKKYALFLFVALPCSIEYQIQMIRPGAQYVIHSGDYAGIEWTDKAQTKPTSQELDAAFSACQTILAPDTGKQQAIADAKNKALPVDQRMDAVVKALGL